MTISAILFDAGDVLYSKPRRAAALAIFLEERGIPAPVNDDPAVKKLRLDAHAGKMTEQEFFERLLAHYGVTDPKDVAEGIELLHRQQRDVDFFEGVPETLHELKRNGFKLGIVTNTYNSKAEKFRWFRPLGIDTVWDSYANSCDLKVIKPEPEIYLAALEPLGLAPEQAAFVGHAQRELDGAKALGMTTIMFNPDPDCVEADHSIGSFSDLLNLPGLTGETGAPAA
ncbi:HAD-IA family hydrolase [Pelagibius sp. CAU 1746]|uniref:HAD family hydrolase n=1 Tax=Pelagibius sp. CAU 1746 TaxID=3140370 RepID=UPI00325B9742